MPALISGDSGGTPAPRNANLNDLANKADLVDGKVPVSQTQPNITGNAGTATKLQTARTINGVAFDGTENITLNATGGGSLPSAWVVGSNGEFWGYRGKVKNITETTYTLVISGNDPDTGKVLVFRHASGCVVTVPKATLEGFICTLFRYGGQITLYKEPGISDDPNATSCVLALQ